MRAHALLLFSLVLLSCSDSGDDQAGIRCGANGSCPTPLVCQPASGLCVQGSGTPDARVVDAPAQPATPDGRVATADARLAAPDAPSSPPDAPVSAPDAAVGAPDAAVATPDAPPPPQVTITPLPDDATAPSGTIAFSAAGASGFTCRVDEGGAAACTSPFAFTGLATGGHTLTVTATSSHGNGSAGYSFTVFPAVTVRAVNAGCPVGGADIVFHAPDGTPRAPVTTGGDGRVQSYIVPGGAVTAHIGSDLYTVFDLQANDDLEMGTAAFMSGGCPSKNVGNVTIRFPSAVDTADQYFVIIGPSCGGFLANLSDGDTVQAAIDERCLDSQGRLQIMARANVDFQPLKTSTVVDLPFVDGATIDLPAWSDPVEVDFQISNPGLLSGSLGVRAFDERSGSFTGYFIAAGSSGNLPASFTLSTLMPPAFADHRVNNFELANVDSDSGRALLSTLRRRVPADNPLAVDLSALLPTITATALDTSTPSRPAASWTVAANPTLGAHVRVSWNGNAARWTLVGPATPATLKAPPLPASLSALAPSGTILLDVVELVDGPSLATYDDFRAHFTEYLSGANNDQQTSWRLPFPDLRLTRSLR